jgi:NIMA (never in mitosis gene a)-related kinase
MLLLLKLRRSAAVPTATRRSPFESQGATLYEVFQRISRCEYQPLPAERWSSPLRTLVARLLQPEPAKRPQLQEVCALARQVLATQVGAGRMPSLQPPVG